MDIAQEEVLTCLGIYLCERLHRIKQKLRAEEQTWQILFCIGVDALRKNFEVRLPDLETIFALRNNFEVCLPTFEATNGLRNNFEVCLPVLKTSSWTIVICLIVAIFLTAL